MPNSPCLKKANNRLCDSHALAVNEYVHASEQRARIQVLLDGFGWVRYEFVDEALMS